MRRAHLLILFAWLLHGVSWFLPVIKENKYSASLPGYAAFLWATCAFHPCETPSGGYLVFDRWCGAVLASASVVTTLLFIFGSPVVALRRSRTCLFASACVAAIAFVVNSHWCVFPRCARLESGGSMQSVLGIGYFLWWLSFAVMATGFFDFARSTPRKSIRTQQAAATL
jgi:hypothetical protein